MKSFTIQMVENKKIICIIQARTVSTRLPAKVLKKIEDKEVLLHVIDRVMDSEYVDLVVIATTSGENDQVIVELIKNYNHNKKK